MRDAGGQVIDDAVVLYFPAPASATGEDVAEFHVHGGRAVLASLFAALSAIENVRAAEPGEFTRRAFENGKLDLTEAEGLDDLIHADTDRQRRQALRQLKGLLGDKARDWRARIIEAFALIEAGIDFSDEGDIPSELMNPALANIGALLDDITEVLAAQGRSERIREGLVVAIAGPPNVGKSTLMNQLARREVAIVSPHAGTTRDIIEVHLELDGYPVTLLDTAGIRESAEPVEREGVRRARERAAAADLVLWVIDLSAIDGMSDGAPPRSKEPPLWLIKNKIDLVHGQATAIGKGPSTNEPSSNEYRFIFSISAARGEGLDAVVWALSRFAGDYFAGGEASLVTRARHRHALEETIAALGCALAEMAVDEPREELIAEELRRAATSLGRLTGRVDVEDVLDAIFRNFCIGK